MIDMGAPEADIDAYVREEGVTLAQLQGTKADGSPRQSQGMPSASPTEPKATPSPDARSIIQSVFPDAEITDWKRDPDSALGRANPSSWHNRSGGAVDIRPIPGMTYEQVLQTIQDAGYPIIEARNEVENPSVWATGPHYHIVLGQRPGDDGGEQPTPDAATAPQSPSKPGYPYTRPLVTNEGEDDSFFRMPKDWNDFGHGLAVGTGEVVEGIADVPGLILDPINTLVGRAMGYDGYTGDFGKTVRESLGLPEDNTLTGDVIKGASGGLGMAGTSRLLAKAGSGVVANGLKELGSTPVRDAVGGAGAALSSGLAQEAGAPVPVQVAAGVLGGATSALGIAKAAERAPGLIDTRTGERLMPQLNQRRFEARQAQNC